MDAVPAAQWDALALGNPTLSHAFLDALHRSGRATAALSELARTLRDLARNSDVSSAPVLFPADADAQALREAGWLERTGVQFHWDNPGYASFEDFLARLSHDKRKKIRQERRRVTEAGVTF